MKKFKMSLCLLLALLLAVVYFMPLTSVYASSAIEVESRTELDDSYMDGFGWLSVTVNPPDDFKEIVCLELFHPQFGTVTIELNPFDWYIAGEWLYNGTYTIKRAYVIGNDDILVVCDLDEVIISHDEDAYLMLSLAAGEGVTFTPVSTERDSETEIPTEQPAAAGTESVEMTMPVSAQSETSSDKKPDILFFAVVIGMVVVLLLPGIFIYIWHRRNQE